MANLIQAAREQVAQLTQAAYEKASAEGLLPAGETIKGTVEVPKDSKNGDFASSFAMAGAKALHMAPRQIAQIILDHLELEGTLFQRAEIAGPGFLNFFYAPKWYGEVLEAVDGSGAVIGHVVAVTAKEGYGGDISITMGIDLTGTITGFEVLSMSETAGLGAKCTNDDFKGQFAGIQAPAEMVMNQDFDQISGATITSKAITKALNASVKFVSEVR